MLWLVFARHDCTFALVCSKDSCTHFMRIETSNNFDLTKFHMLVNKSSQSSSLHTIAVLPDSMHAYLNVRWRKHQQCKREAGTTEAEKEEKD